MKNSITLFISLVLSLTMCTVEPCPGTTSSYGTLSGKVICEGRGISGVVVSDGITAVVTDAHGRYSFKSDGKLGYVFISIPGGFTVPCDGPYPIFWKDLSGNPGKVDFELVRDPGQEDHTMMCIGDFHLAGIHSDRRQCKEWIEDINGYVASREGKKVYGITVGDMTWDVHWVSSGYNLVNFKEEMRSLKGFTLFPVIGNHDHELEAAGPVATTALYRKLFGPLYYSFNIGNVHYVVLDAVESTNDGKGRRSYVRHIVPEEYGWLEKDLSFVDPSAQIVVVSHIPPKNMDDGDKLKGCFGKFDKPVHYITAHYHMISNENNLDKPELDVQYYDHMVAGPAGSLWNTGYYSPGIHICKDGTPGGYFLLYSSPKGLSWQYKSTGHGLDYQFRTYDGNCIWLDPSVYVPRASSQNLAAFTKLARDWAVRSSDNYVYINCWERDSKWTVKVTENGKPLKVEKVKVADPLHIISYPAKLLDSPDTVGTIEQNTVESPHFLRVKALSPDSTLEITITDRFGNEYKETMTRPKAFVINNYLK